VKRLEMRHSSGDITAGDLCLAVLFQDPEAIARCNAASPDCKVMRDVAAFLAGLEGNKPAASRKIWTITKTRGFGWGISLRVRARTREVSPLKGYYITLLARVLPSGYIGVPLRAASHRKDPKDQHKGEQ
jgi:hypothetical protein